MFHYILHVDEVRNALCNWLMSARAPNYSFGTFLYSCILKFLPLSSAIHASKKLFTETSQLYDLRSEVQRNCIFPPYMVLKGFAISSVSHFTKCGYLY
jgi:hypothetical protein